MIRSSDYHYMDEDSIHVLLKCPLCSKPFIDPVISTNGKRSCRSCLSSNDERENAIPVIELLLLDFLNDLRVKCIKCGEENIRRCEFEKHTNTECSHRTIPCTAADLKCSWTGLYEELQYHSKSCLFESLRPIFAEILAENIQFKEQIKQNRICYDKQQVEIEKLKERDYDESSNENEQLKKQIEQYRIRNDSLQNELKQLSEFTSQSNTFGKVIQDLKEQYNKLQTEIEQLKELYNRLVNQNNDFRNNLDQLNKQITHNNELLEESPPLKQQSILFKGLQTEFNQLKQSDNPNNELQNKIKQLQEHYNQQYIQYEQLQYEVKQLSEYITKYTTQTLQLNTQDQNQKDDIIQIKQLCNQHDIQIKLLARKKCVIPAVTSYSDAKLERLIEQSPSNSEINLNEKQLSDREMDIVYKQAIVNKKCEKLRLEKNDITAKGATILASALYNNTTLVGMYLSKNRISDMGVQALAQTLSINNSTLRCLDLHSNNITDEGAEYLAEMLKTNKTITMIGLGFNQIGDQGVQLLANAITYHNENLESLYLSSNRSITDMSIAPLSEMLKYNPSLKALWLDNCNISTNAATKLRQMIETNKKFILEV